MSNKKVVLKVEYLIDDDKMTDEEYENQEFKEFEITEEMIMDLIEEETGRHICQDNLFITKV